MSTFHAVFAAAMILFPVAVSWLYRAHGNGVDRALLRRRRIALHLATLGALVLLGALLAGDAIGWWSAWADLPRFMTWSDSPSQLGWILFFPLWFAFAMPVIAAARPETVSPRGGGAVRTASLAPRTGSVAMPVTHRIAALALFLAGAGVVALAVARGDAPRAALAALFLLGGGLPSLVVTPAALRGLAFEPEPLDPTGSPELVEAYARHRAAKVRGLASLSVVLVALFAGLAACVVLWPDRPAVLGIAGGLGGTAVGIAGAALGVRTSAERERIRRTLDRLTAEAGTIETRANAAGGGGS
jgi:hypothetical protein